MSKLSATLAFAQVAVAGLLGLVALPTLFRGTSDGGVGSLRIPLVADAWLVVGLGLSGWLLALAPSLASTIAHLLERLDLRQGRVVGQQVAIGSVARLIVAVVDVAIVQAILRRPVVAVLGDAAAPSTVDATFAAGTLILLILILIWLHQSARPLIEAVAWQALDAIVPTTGSGQSTAFADDSDTMLATVLAQTQSVDTAVVLTRPTGADEPTLAALDDATRPAPRGPIFGWSDATIAAVPSEQTVDEDPSATRRAPTPTFPATTSADDETTVTPGEEDGTQTSIGRPDDTIPDGASATRPNTTDR